MRYFFVILSLLVLSPVSGFAATYYVPDDFSNIQEAIDAAITDDTIIVRPGTYLENIDFGDKGIILKSEMGAHSTIIDGNRSGPVVTFDSWPDTGDDPGFTIDGFTITNGSGHLFEGFSCQGGGIYMPFNASSSPVIKNNIVTDNIIDEPGLICAGGGIYSSGGHPFITNNIITDNTVIGESTYAGGIYLSNGGFSVRNNRIAGNSVIGDYPYGIGGGLQIDSISSGDVGLMGSNIIADNFASGSGGGVFLFGDTQTGWVQQYNNLFVGNQAHIDGGALFLNYYTIVYCTNDTFVNNSATQGGGIFSDYNDLYVANSIFWNNQATTGKEIYYDGTSNKEMTISHSDVEGGQGSVYVEPGSVYQWGPGMIDADPLFVDATGGDFHLSYTSPCRNAGDSDIGTVPTQDFEKDPRIAFGIVDMGADEFHNHLYCTGDFIPNGSIEGKFIGLPGANPVGLFIGSGVMDPPLQHGWGEFYLESPWFLFPLIPIPADGVLVIPATLPVNPAPYDIPMQALIGWELSNLFVLEVR